MPADAALDIKEATPAQFDEIWPIFQEVVLAADTYPYSPDTTKGEALPHWFMPHGRVYIGYLEGEPAATIYIVPNKTGLGSHVANLGVMVGKSQRGQGLGRKMMEFGIAKARELGYRAMQYNMVVSLNAASIKICKECGFEIIGTLPEAFYYKGERYVDAYVMYRKL